tara:strand:- start:273 stop:467 length:195 start_codon:yes stop_codon:yes gene_type:complete
MKVKPFTDKLQKFNAVGMPCTSKEFNDLKDGKEIALTEETAELMQSMGLVKIVEDKKSKSKEKK